MGIVAEWGAFAVEHVQGFALLDTGASRTVGDCMMVQHVIDSLLQSKTQTWVESAEPTVNVSFAGGELAQSGTKVWLPLPGEDSEQFCLRGSKRLRFFLIWTRHVQRVWCRD